jgi:hypothetical protein
VSAPRIELTNLGPAKAWVGQLVPVEVSVWRPEGDKPLEPFSLDDVIAAGAIVKWSDQNAPPDERQDGDTHFLVQHRTLLVFPQAEGSISVPPIVARYTDPVAKAPVVVKSAKLTFASATPPGSGDTLPLVATSATLQQTFDRDIGSLKVGDGFTRTLTLSATDTDAIVFPELTPPAVSGVTMYPGGLHASSTTERGQIAAKQTFSVTYVLDRVGPHSMPGLSIRWLEPRTGKYQEARIEDQTLWARPNFALGFSCLGTAQGAALATGIAVIATITVVLLAIARRVRLGPGRLERAFRERRREQLAFREVLHAMRSGAARQCLDALYAWLVIRSPKSLDRTLGVFRHSTPDARNLSAAVEQSLFRNGSTILDIANASAICRQARAALKRRETRVAPSLNPVPKR